MVDARGVAPHDARTDALRAVLDRIIGRAPAAAEDPGRGRGHGNRPTGDGAPDAWALGLAAFEASFALDHTGAREHARAALAAATHGDPASDPAAVVLACAGATLAAAGIGVARAWTSVAPGLTATGDPLLDACDWLDALPESDAGRFARYALAEAALACGRLGVAERIVASGAIDGDRFLEGPDGIPHPFASVMTVLVARILAFAGRIDAARATLDRIPVTTAPLVELVVEATRCLVDGNAAQVGAVRSVATRVTDRLTARSNRLELGCALLAAYGLVAIGDLDRSAELAAGRHWDRAMIVDRAIVVELLVNSTAAADDREAMEAWAAVAEQLDGDPICDTTLDRTRARARLALGDLDGAAEAADRAAERARREGRIIEAAEAEMVAARARVAAGQPGVAARRLEVVVHTSDADGFAAVRRAAGRTLQRTGRRVRPAAGSGALGLSARERDVLARLLRGMRNAEIAADLHISLHTARVHVSRVLAAHGAATRLDLVRQVLATETAESPAIARAAESALSTLSPRQRDVLDEVMVGASNPQIAERLGIAERTVEKHIADVMRRWGVDSRVGLVLVGSGRMAAARRT